MMGHDRLVLVHHHHVGWPPRSARYKRMFVTPGLLAFQVRMLRLAGYGFHTLRDALRTPGKCAVVTFDDGYQDTLDIAAPVLDRLGVPATVFVVSSDVGRRQVQWEESGDRLPGDLMGWADLSRLQDRGWEVGSHGHQHVKLGRRSPAAQAEIVERGRETIAHRLGVAPQAFAYPFGSFTDTTVDAVRLAGFACAATTVPGAHGRDRDVYRLRRQAGGGRRADHYVTSLRFLF